MTRKNEPEKKPRAAKGEASAKECGDFRPSHEQTRSRAHVLRIKRTYDPPARSDGRRVLVERLWPRGMKKESLAHHTWRKGVAPSTELRKWFDHRVERWDEFRRRYRDELSANPAAWKPILDASRKGTVTLLYSARDTLHNGAVVLREFLEEKEAGHAVRGAPAGGPRVTKRRRPFPR